MKNSKKLMPIFAIAIMAMLISGPVLAEGTAYSLDLNGQAKIIGTPGKPTKITIAIDHVELPADIDVTIKDATYTLTIVAIDYVLDPAGGEWGVDIGDVTITFANSDTLDGTITTAYKTMDEPTSLYQYEMKGLHGRVDVSGSGDIAIFTAISGIGFVHPDTSGGIGEN